jgi:hypothetical protein
VRPEDVAAAPGMRGKAVHAWLKKYREGGQDTLSDPPAGPANESGLRELPALLIETEPPVNFISKPPCEQGILPAIQ